MKKLKKYLCLMFVFLFTLCFSACTSPEEEGREHALAEMMPLEYTVPYYEDYLPSNFRYYDDDGEKHVFTVTYETDSPLIKIEEPKDYPYPKSIESSYGKTYYYWSVASKYKSKLSDTQQQFNVKCTYLEETTGVTFVIDRVFTLLPSGEYLKSKLEKNSSVKGWECENGIYTATTTKKSSTTFSDSHKVTTTTRYEFTYNHATGDLVCMAYAQTFTSKGWDNTTSQSQHKYAYNFLTDWYAVDDVETSIRPKAPPLSTVISAIQTFNNDYASETF
jgi:hypothetical protein